MATTAVATVALGLAHPYLCLLMAYDYFLLGRFSFAIMNNTLQSIMLTEDNTPKNLLHMTDEDLKPKSP